MRIATALILTLYSAQALAQSPLTIEQVVKNKDRVGTHPLDQGYLGQFTKQFDEHAQNESSFFAEPFEFTHAYFPNSKHPDISDEDLPINEIVVGLQKRSGTGEFLYRAPTVSTACLPPFDDLTKLQDIQDYELIFGKFRGFAGSYMDRDGSLSLLNWLAFTTLENGKIRVVSVVLHTRSKGNSREIVSRVICEGEFEPTGKPPLLEKAEPSDPPKSPIGRKLK